ncbi:tetratricopeptide repeat protein [Mucilaginibacter sp. BJC16-A38]|uniref:tetratricopeptide repeat protein n=1 Tax=Mucilaginibacter phenanthrenivorans TaxID=1234842 RepID=UPI00215776AF|nr:tetratricopeptide repeat protein [Mucilaginibacter phenanthrenivorans]MCR8558252.1 tetratricopeptide repeat protein [Mucilaginibacter phenanthrenivorans]
MRIYITLLLLFISISGFAAVDRGRVDSLKTLVASSLNGQSEPDTISINRLNKLAVNYFDSNPDSTLYYGHKAIDLARKINYKAGLANALVQTGRANFPKGKFTQAQLDFDEAISIYKTLNDLPGLAYCYKLYGRMDNLLAKYQVALYYLNQALDINVKLKNDAEIADCYKNIGIVYFSEGQNSTALDYYYKGLYITLKADDKGASAAIYNDIGVVLQGMEVYPKALDYYRKALSLFKGIKNLNGVGTINENIGEVLIAHKEYDRAIVHLTKAINIAKKQDDKDGMSSVYTDLGLCYAHKNQFGLAKRYLDTSLQIASTYKIVYNQAYALIGMATMYNLQKDFANAYKYATEGQKLAGTLRNLTVRSNAALQLNQTLAGLGRFDDAYKMLRRYNELRDSLNNNESIQKLTSNNLELDFASKERALKQQNRERDESYKQRIKQQRLINTVFLTIIAGMITVSIVYYRQKRKQQKINTLLEERNREVLQQKSDLDDQAQKLNNLNVLKDRLISVLAHDLRAPLSTLRGLFSLLQDETISHEQMLEMIPGVLKKLEYTSDFLDTLLFWINSQMDNFESSAKSFHLKDIVAYETESYYEQAKLKGITLIDNVPSDAVASADPNSIRIVIRNLITNAIKFSSQGDIIEVSAIQQDDHNYIISVKDTGTGMSDEQLGKLFKSKVNSFAGTNNESGTGMGMLFCKDLVEKCSGKIWVTSKLGHGTKFSFTVPMGTMTEKHLQVA